MSSLSDSEGCLPTITPSSSIAQLIEVIKHSFRDCEFTEVQNMLMDRENKLKIEIQDLKADLDSARKEARLLERVQSLTELQKLRLEEEVHASQRKCEELNEEIVRLTGEQRISSDRARRAEERYEKVCQENSKMANEKNKVIFELNERIHVLKSKNLENEGLVGGYEEKLKGLGARVSELGQEIEDLRRGKLGDDQRMEELKRENRELRIDRRESDEAVEVYRSRFENLAPRVMKAEAVLAGILNVKVEDFGKIVDAVEKSGVKGENVGLLDDFEGGEDRNGDAEDVPVLTRRCASASMGGGGGGISGKCGRNLVNPLSKEDGVNTVGTSPGSRSGCNSVRVESNDTARHNGGEEPLASGYGTKHSTKMTRSSSAVEDVIVICDSDDETKPDDISYTSSGQTNTRNKRDAKS